MDDHRAKDNVQLDAAHWWVDIDPEFYDDGEGIHFHFDSECPACNARHAGTYVEYGITGIEECLSEYNGIFWCEECQAKFQLKQYEYGGNSVRDGLVELLERQEEDLIAKITDMVADKTIEGYEFSLSFRFKPIKGFFAVTSPPRWENDDGEFLGLEYAEVVRALNGIVD